MEEKKSDNRGNQPQSSEGSGNQKSGNRRPRRAQNGGQKGNQQRPQQQGGQSQNRSRNNQRGRGGQRGRGRGNGRNPESHYKTPANGKRSADGVYTDINQAIAANKEVHKERLETAGKIDINNKARVRFTPLGGLGEIGGNIAVLETEKSAIVIDVGMSFPTEDMHGVDILVPDFSYLHAIKDKIAGIVITHAHEDHIGAVPYLFKELKFPIYGTPLPLGMIANKFDEHGLKNDKSYFRYIEKRKP
ncbi:MAG: MBL fold metallo-hydrolase, partial [Hydrogenimonas sp.]|nr:MBL fold metallo-hydrolase [Hydrogenimonas sp.]